MAARFFQIKACPNAFTLIEIAIALGIVAIVLTGIAGVWPTGQDRLKGAIDTTIAAQLAQRISAEVEVADFSDVLHLAGMVGNAAPTTGSLPRRYFSYAGREVLRDDSDRIYEVLTRVSHRGQLPSKGGATRPDAQGQLMLSIEVVGSPAGLSAPVGTDGLVDRVRCGWRVISFPFVVGGNSSW